jgi:DNA-binding CsgD family transcriptional regulator
VNPTRQNAVMAGELARARDAYAGRSWLAAFEAFSRADAENSLDAPDLQLLATCAYMLGREEEWVAAHERAHRAYLDAGEIEQAARAAFWIGLSFALKGEIGPASGWFGRAQRLLDGRHADSVERGFLLIPQAIGMLDAGEFAASESAAAEALVLADRFGSRDLFAIAVLTQGQALAFGGRVSEGLALLDEAMVAVTTEDLSPVVAGIVYCGVILSCQEVFEVRRAREWTTALDRWCRQQPDLVAFTGRCLVHRAEVLQMGGSWSEALEEARRACRRFAETQSPVAGVALYREAELHRLRGEFDEAEEDYRAASAAGWEPQPGLAQLRLAQGQGQAALVAIRRADAELREPLKRATLLPAHVEIALAAGEIEAARSACHELSKVATGYASSMLSAMAAYARGAIALADDDPKAALGDLREAQRLWRELDAPYEVARTRALLAAVCSRLGDDESAALEREAARETFRRLGAAPDLARLPQPADHETYGLSRRELEVLRLVARGQSNREIAAGLVLSEHTVARHLQNIYGKLRLPSRAAATAFAFEHDLV